MIDPQFEFPKPTLEQWKEQFAKELKGSNADILEVNDEVEELNYSCYQHSDSKTENNQTINELFDFKSHSKKDNNWLNCATLLVSTDTDVKSLNEAALNFLNTGADALRFILSNDFTDILGLTKGIEFQYIQTHFVLQSIEQFVKVQSALNVEDNDYITLELDAIGIGVSPEVLVELHKNSADKIQPTLVVNGYKIQQTGATNWQEIGFSLNVAHSYLLTLLESGKSTVEANKFIQFNLGVGSNYFYEIAKPSVLIALWNKIITHYNSNHISSNPTILSLIGFMNKSLKDPYTNLLRQTTEAMSAASGGVTAICVQPYDLYSHKGASSIAERMGLNISTILKEESYFDAVNTPQIGSYTEKLLSDLIANKSWEYFQKLEQLQSISLEEWKTQLRSDIIKKQELRIQRLIDKKDALIGINLFPNNKEELDNPWVQMESYLDIPMLILEQHLNQEKK